MEIFDEADQLLYQQLVTERKLKEKLSNQDQESIPSEDNIEIQNAEGHWRLVPVSVRLHHWQQETLPIWLKGRRGTVKVATGGGKTVFALKVAEQLQREIPKLQVIILVPTITLMNQWFEELQNSNLPPENIQKLGGGNRLSDDSDFQILIAVLNSARDHLPGFIGNKLRLDRNWLNSVLLIVDECHRANSAANRTIFEAGFQNTLGLSATPEPNEPDATLTSEEAYHQSPVGKALGKIIRDYSLREALQDGLLTKFVVQHVAIPLTEDEYRQHAALSNEITELRKGLQQRLTRNQNFFAWIQNQSQSGNDQASQFQQLTRQRKLLLYRSANREKFVEKIFKEKLRENKKIILFHETIDQVNSIYLKAKENNLPVVLEHSKLPPWLRDENIDLFRRDIAKIIVSAKSLVEGFNVPSADLGIIAASSGSPRQRIQSLGRLLRKSGKDDSLATVFILYIKDTEDEAIYQNADWHQIIGSEQNQYFEWDPQVDRLLQQDGPPREYLPPCNSIDERQLQIGEKFPASPEGLELRLDETDTLKANDGRICVPKENSSQNYSECIQLIRSINQFKRAKLTPCNQIIAKNTQNDWIYITKGDLSENASESEIYLIKRNQGRLKISKKIGRVTRFASEPDAEESLCYSSPRELIQSARLIDAAVRKLHWDGKQYFVETHGNRVVLEGENKSLLFRGNV